MAVGVGETSVKSLTDIIKDKLQTRGVIRELRLLRASVDRLADLKELELNAVHRITTRTEQAKASDLEDTQVGYSDVRVSEALMEAERIKGRPLTMEETAAVMGVVESEPGDE